MVVSSSSRVRVVCALALVTLSACFLIRRGEGGPDKPEKPNDGNIAAMFLAANNTDISYAQVALAPGRTTTPAILGFANRMLSDHGGLAQAARELFATSGITPEANIISLNFIDESAAKRDTLRERTGVLFDSTYIANEVKYHTRLLVVVDSVLIPNARNKNLKAMLESVRPAVAAHLEHAQRVQAGLGK